MPVIEIASAADPRVDDFRKVSDAELLRRRSMFVGEGRLVVQRLIDGGHRIAAVMVNPASRAALAAPLSRLDPQVPVYVCATSDFESITGFNLHRGCLALVERPAGREPAEVIRGARVVLALEDVSDADNVGSAFRNAAAFGVPVLLSPRCCDPLYRKAVRTSMGAVLHVPYARCAGWPAELREAQAAGFGVLVLTPRADALDISTCAGSRPVVLVVGNEGAGVTREVEAIADAAVRIPVSNEVDSLNAATAAAIALHHFTRVAVIP